MSQISTKTTASIIGALTDLTGNSGGTVSPDGADNINIVTNTPTEGGTNPTTVIGTPGDNTLTITQNIQTLVQTTTAISGTADIFTYTMISGKGLVITANIIGIPAAAAVTESWGGTIIASASNDGFSVIDYQVKNCDGPDPAVQADFVASGNDVILRLTGSDTAAFTWKALMTYVEHDTDD